MHGNGPNIKTNECDLLIAWECGSVTVSPEPIHLCPSGQNNTSDIDKSEFGKNVKPDVAVLATAAKL